MNFERAKLVELREKVLKRLKDTELSVAEIGRRGGIHPNTIHSFKKGKSQNLSMSNLRKVCKGLGITVEELENEEDGKIKMAMQQIKMLKKEEQEFILNMIYGTITQIRLNRK